MAKLARIPNGLTEKQFQGFVVQVAKLYGWWVYHTFDSRRSAHGWPDLVLIRGSVIIYAELKTDKGKLSKHQTEVIARLREANQTVYVWRPADWDEICELLTHRAGPATDGTSAPRTPSPAKPGSPARRQRQTSAAQ